MQAALSRIWTQVDMCIFYDNDHSPMTASTVNTHHASWVSSILIGYSIHSALCYMEAESFVNYYNVAKENRSGIKNNSCKSICKLGPFNSGIEGMKPTLGVLQ